MARAFKVYAQSHQHGYGEDRYYGEFVLAFSSIEFKVPFTDWHLAAASVGKAMQLSGNVKKFGEQVDVTFGAEDIGLRKLTELPQEEWNVYMRQEGLTGREYGYLKFEAPDALVQLLRQKSERREDTSHDPEIDAGLTKIVLAKKERRLAVIGLNDLGDEILARI